MNKILIHISDLHFTDPSQRFGESNKNTFLKASDKEKDLNFLFAQSFIDKIKEIKCSERYLIVTGDITNIAEDIEFEYAINFFKKIIEGLNISRNNILIIPGDHDVHRDSIKNELRNDSSKQGWELHEVKFNNFQKLYNSIYDKAFDFNNLIFKHIVIDDILLVGVNSNFKVSNISANGFLPIEEFDKELEELIKKHEGKKIILAFHHNISGTYEDKISGQWELTNRKNLMPIFIKHKISCVLYGNEHTPKSTRLESYEFFVSESGALAGINPPGSFKVYEIIKTDKSLKLKNNIFHLKIINAVNEPCFGEWQTQIIEEARQEIGEIILWENNSIDVNESIDIIENPEIDEGFDVNASVIKEQVLNVYSSEENRTKLYDLLKQKKLFHTGHFHWSETSRAHNWIDVSKLLEDKDDLFFIKNAIIDVIETFNLQKDCDLIIGLGYEGNIIASKASVKYNINYSYLPYSYRYEEYLDYEKELNYSNSEKEYKTVIIITDVVNNGNTIKSLITENEKDFFLSVEKIIVISLFYTGYEDINVNILREAPESNIDNEKKDIINRIDFYTIMPLRVEKCPYKEKYPEQCFIYKDKLNPVHIFYDESKK